MPYIYQVQTTYPPNTYNQEEMRNVIATFWPDKADLIKQFFSSTRVEKRNLALPLQEYEHIGDFGKRNEHWKAEALALQKQNVESILTSSKLGLDDINLLTSVNTTGLCVPSLEALLMNKLPFSSKTKRLPIFGLGCLGGVAGINRVNDYLKGHPKEAALVLVTELCSLTFQLKDSSVANLISSALFGDGAGAIIMLGSEHPLIEKSFLEILNTKSYFYRDTEHLMGWEMVDSGFQIQLSNEIPDLISNEVGKNVNEFIRSCGFERKDIDFFIAHPGGPKVMEAMVVALEAKKEDIALSWESLAEHGNVSSVSVINVLEKSMQRLDIKKGSLGIMLAMGPAFSLELSLVKRC